MLAGVSSALSVIAQVHRTSPGKLLLHQQEDVLWDDRFVIALYVVLRNGAIVLDPLLRQEVCGIGFLEQGVADVFFVSQEQEQKPSKLPYAIGLILLIGACGAGGAFFYLKNKKSQAESAERPDPDADYREDDDGYDIPEESEEDEAEDFDDEEE